MSDNNLPTQKSFLTNSNLTSNEETHNFPVASQGSPRFKSIQSTFANNHQQPSNSSFLLTQKDLETQSYTFLNPNGQNQSGNGINPQGEFITTKNFQNQHVMENKQNKENQDLLFSPFEEAAMFRPHSQMICDDENSSRKLNKISTNQQSMDSSSNTQFSFKTKNLLILPNVPISTTKKIDNPRRSCASKKIPEDCLTCIYLYLLSRDGLDDVVRDIQVGKEYWMISFRIADQCCEQRFQPNVSIRFYKSGFNEFKTIIEFIRESGDTLVYDRFFHEIEEHLTSKRHILPANHFSDKPEIQIGIRETALKILSSSESFESNVPFDKEEWEALEKEFSYLDLKLDNEI